jgi:hypothetical protein
MPIGTVLNHSFVRNLRDTVATIRAIAFLATPLISIMVVAYAAWGVRWLATDVAVMALSGLTICTALLAWAMRNARLIRPENRLSIVSLSSTLRVERNGNHHRYTQTKDQVVLSNTVGNRLIEQSWMWSGQSSKPYVVESLFPDHTMFDGGRPDRDNYTHRWIYIGREIHKKERVRVGSVLVVEDDVQPMRKFFFDGVGNQRVKDLTMVLQFPGDEDPEKVEGGHWPPHSDTSKPRLEVPVMRNRKPDGIIEYKIHISNPRRRRVYGLFWQ